MSRGCFALSIFHVARQGAGICPPSVGLGVAIRDTISAGGAFSKPSLLRFLTRKPFLVGAMSSIYESYPMIFLFLIYRPTLNPVLQGLGAGQGCSLSPFGGSGGLAPLKAPLGASPLVFAASLGLSPLSLLQVLPSLVRNSWLLAFSGPLCRFSSVLLPSSKNPIFCGVSPSPCSFMHLVTPRTSKCA